MKNIELKRLKKEWLKAATRRMSYQKVRLYFHGLHDGYENIFGRGHCLFLSRTKKGNTWTYTEKQETKDLMKYLKNIFINPDYIIKNLARMQQNLETDFEECVEDIKKFPQDWQGVKNSILVQALRKYYKIDNSVSAYHWILFNEFERMLTESVEKLMVARGIKKNDVKRTLLAMSEPTLITPLDMERISILKVALKKGEEQKKALLEHQKEFSFMPMYDIDYKSYSLEHFGEELKKIRQAHAKEEIRKEAEDIRKKYVFRKEKRAEFVHKYKSMPEIVSILEFYGTFANYKDRKPFVRDQVSYYVRNLFREIAERLSLSLTQVLYLTDFEIEQALTGRKKISKIEAGSRVRGSACLFQDEKVRIFTSEEDLAIIDNILEKNKNVKEFKGLPVSPGKGKGAVSIVLSNTDFPKFKRGQIFITSATRPDFVPLIKKAAAVITDEGGLLSHAAIISRELRVPCIVGTKIATKVLQDGDLVEVDANKGVVRIIKKNKYK